MENREKLKQLLKHWVAHNEEHAAEFREWAVKAGEIDAAGVADDIMAAANQMERANEFLDRAAKTLGD